jgi:RNA polymerase sigma factor for flagellar operon FliA
MARISKTTIKTATQRFLVDRSDYHRDRLVEALLPWIRLIARKLKGQYPTKLEPEDLEQFGAIGLIKALERYDGQVKVQTFTLFRVRGAMIDACRDDSITPRLVQQSITKIYHAENQLAQELGRKATEEEVRGVCDLGPGEYSTAARFRQAAHQVSVLTTFRDDAGGDVETPTAIDESSPYPSLQEKRRQFLRLVLGMCSRTERMLLLGYYFEDLTMKQIGQSLDLSESRVSQLHSYLLRTLREAHGARKCDLFELARAG